MAACSTCGEQNPEGAQSCLTCGAVLDWATTGPRPGGGRRTVTILFADLEGSTEIGDRLDPEALSALMDRYFDSVSAVVRRHGGTVEKYIGDAVMAVFGVPRLHEDDALRAVRAASEIVQAMRSSNHDSGAQHGTGLAIRVAINTGEVIANPPTEPGQRLVTGDAVNVASRLQAVAHAGDVVLSGATYELVRDRVTVGPVEAIQLRGKHSPIPVYRLEQLIPEVPFVRSTASLVGRDRELGRLQTAFEACVAESRCELFTIIGPAGLGKSRLAWELEQHLGDRAAFVRGRCLSYGQGITYWPVAEIVRSAVGIGSSDSHEAARDRLGAFLAHAPDGQEIARRVAQVIGLEVGTFPREELYWSVRRLLQVRSAEKPLVVVVDDIHWAEPSLLDLLDDLVDRTKDVPLLLLCIARPDLLDHRPGWGGGKRNATNLVLEALANAQANDLLGSLASSTLPPDVVSRISDAAGGNPLFIEEMFRMLVDGGSVRQEDGQWVAGESLADGAIPSTIQALLASRLDQLEPLERVIAQRAAVVGRSFDEPAVAELLPESATAELPRHLRVLVQSDVLRLEDATGPALARYRFRHDLIRDAAYASLPKADRADLHERHARWLELAMADRITEYDAIIGHHFDQAYRYLTELGQAGIHTRAVGHLAGQWLTRAGQAANWRSDAAAAARLLSRAIDLLDRDDPVWVSALMEYGDVLSALGDYSRAGALLKDAVAISTSRDPATARKARLYHLYWRSQTLGLSADTIKEAERLADECVAAGDDWLSAQAVSYLAVNVYQSLGRVADARAMLLEARRHAERSGDRDLIANCVADIVGLGVRDGTPCLEVLDECRNLLGTSGVGLGARATALEYLGVLPAMRAEFDDARVAIREAQRIDEELGALRVARSRGLAAGLIEQLAGNHPGAEAAFRDAYLSASEIGDALALFVAARLARPLHELGRDEEALKLIEENPGEDSLWTKILQDGVKARILAGRGQTTEAVELADTMLGEAREGGFEALPNIFAGALEDVAAVMRHAGRRTQARELLEDAIRRYEAKGNIAAAGRARKELAEIEATSA
jgi:class 3 adenylate cyclase/tetratricopeptide (TPR) repeat protein